MTRDKAYKFCLQCGHSLTKKGPYLFRCDQNHPYYISPKPTVCVIVEKDHQVLIIKRGEEPHQGSWEFPGGFISPKEDLVFAAAREIKEELGISIKINVFVGAYPDIYSFRGVDYEVLVSYLTAEITQGTPTASSEASEYKFVDKEALTSINFGFDSDKQVANDYLKLNSAKHH